MSWAFLNATAATVQRMKATPLNLGSGNPLPLTIAGWAKFPSGSGGNAQPIWFLVNGPTYDRWLHFKYYENGPWVASKGFLADLQTDGTDGAGMGSANVLMASGTWHHFAIIYQGTTQETFKIYVDGVDDTLNTTYFATATDYSLNLTEMWIGKGFGDEPINLQAEMGVWKAALSPTDISFLAVSKYAPSLVDPTNLRHYWSLKQGDADGIDGRSDKKGSANLTVQENSPVADSDHPAGMVYALGTSKYDILTSAADGTVRKLFVWTDESQTAWAVNNVTVTASGGHFKYAHASATVGVAKPAMLTNFGADATVPAQGGGCWATGISE